jgi:hypothetical protein
MTRELHRLQEDWRAAEAEYTNALIRHQRESTAEAWEVVMEAWRIRCGTEAAYEHGAIAQSLVAGQ